MTQPPDPGDPFAPPSSAPPNPPPVQPGWGPPPPQYAQGGWGPPPSWGTAPKTNVLAILALVFSFLCFPAAIVLGVIALVQLRSSEDRGKGLAIAGLAISGFWIALIALFVTLGVAGVFDGASVSTGAVSRAGTTTVGRCMLSQPDAEQNRVLSCAQAHDQEVYAVTQLPDGPYPGTDEVDSSADAICHAAFKGFVGTSYEDSDHDYDFYVPDRDEWTLREERRVVCVITPAFGNRDYDSAYHKGE